MARVVKKVKKENDGSNGKLNIILGSIAGVLAIGCLIAFLVIYISDNMVTRLYSNSRDMDYTTLVELDSDSSVREKYERTIYVFVFHSLHEEEEYSGYSINDNQNSKVRSAITLDLKLNEYYSNQSIEQQKRTSFYALDLYDSANEGLLDDSKFGYSSESAYVLTITNSSSGLSVSKKAISTSYLTEINAKLTTEVDKYK
ncbi:MAG: hypothetical protein R3Y60_00465 [bacterium]